MGDIQELRAEIDAATHSADAFVLSAEPTSVPQHVANRAKVALLEQRRARYLAEATSVVEERQVLSDTESLFVSRLLDAVKAIDAELPRYRELASADEQHAETCRTFCVTTLSFRD